MTQKTKLTGLLTSIFLTIIMLFSGWRLARAAEPVSYRLKWLYNTSVVGDLYAKEYGLFEDEGLDVTVKAGGPERDAIRELELGHAQFGVASADQVIRAYAKGAPVVVVAQLFQINPLQWIYRGNKKSIQNIRDLKGKIIGITYGGNDETIMRTLLLKGGITEKEVTFFSVRYDYLPFYQGRVDIWPVYCNAQGIILREKLLRAGETVCFFNPADHGILFVANSVVTSQKMLKQHPDLVKSFSSALLAGWRMAFDPTNREKAISVLEKYDRDTPAAIREKQLSATQDLVSPQNGEKVGYIDMPAWKQTEQIMLKQNLISKPVCVENILRPQGRSLNPL